MDPIFANQIVDVTTGGISLIQISGGSTGQVLTKQGDGTYAPAAVSAGIGGTVGTTDNRLPRSDGTGGSTLQASGVTIDDSNNITGAASLSCTGITASSNATVGGYLNASGGVYVGSYDALVTKSGSGASRTLDLCSVSTVRARNYGNAADAPFSAAAITASGTMCAGTYTVATLPSAAANAYKFATASDSSVTTFGSTVAGSGSSKVMVYSNGTNWTVCAA